MAEPFFYAGFFKRKNKGFRNLQIQFGICNLAKAKRKNKGFGNAA